MDTFINSLINKGIPAINSNDDIGPTNKNYIKHVLSQNTSKNFVKRILTPDDYPVLADWDGPNTFGTHAMSYVSGDDGAYVYPTITQEQSGKLIRRNPRDAWNYAKRNNEFIRVPTSHDAEVFGTMYKDAAGWNDNTFDTMKQKAALDRFIK